MKVLHLSSEKAWRGGEQQIAYLIEELEKLGINNLVACRLGSEFEKFCLQQGIPFYSLPFANSLDLRTAFGLKSICRSESPSLMHLHSSKGHGVGVLSAWLGNPVPMVLSRRVAFPLKGNWLSRRKYNSRNIKKILCVSDAVKKVVQKEISQPEKAVTVYSGIDLDKFSASPGNYLRSRYQIPEGSWLIGSTSAISPEKDYHTFIDTVELLEQDNFPAFYLIMGKGSLEQEIKAYAKAKGLDKKIIFTGFLKNVPQLLPELDLLLMTSKTEGLGTSVLDAFACNVPVVATAAGGIPELVLHEQTGLLAPVGDSKTLAKEIQNLFTKPAVRKQLVRNAGERVLQFSKSCTAQRTAEIYKQALNEPD